jgi:hypothetical protein
MDSTVSEIVVKESSSLGASGMSSMEGYGNGELQCSGVPQEAAGQDSDSVSLETA